MAGHMVYWGKDYVKELEKAGDKGPFKVDYGSQHQIMPSISAVKTGDVIYAVTIQNGTLAVMARLPVEKSNVHLIIPCVNLVHIIPHLSPRVFFTIQKECMAIL